jgi:hypothetical protein
MEQICQMFAVSRQAHYQQSWREVERQQEHALILEMVRMVRRRHPRMGTRKLLYKIQPMLALEGLQIGRDRLFGLLPSRDAIRILPGPQDIPNIVGRRSHRGMLFESFRAHFLFFKFRFWNFWESRLGN